MCVNVKCYFTHQHIFCEECISHWFNQEKTCPLCRTVITDKVHKWKDGATSSYLQIYWTRCWPTKWQQGVNSESEWYGGGSTQTSLVRETAVLTLQHLVKGSSCGVNIGIFKVLQFEGYLFVCINLVRKTSVFTSSLYYCYYDYFCMWNSLIFSCYM